MPVIIRRVLPTIIREGNTVIEGGDALYAPEIGEQINLITVIEHNQPTSLTNPPSQGTTLIPAP